MSLFFIFCIWVNTPILAQEGKGRFQKSSCCWEILQPENEFSTNWRGHFFALRLDSMWCFLKWLHPFHHPLPHHSPDHTVQSSSWNDASLTWLGIIQDGCCDQSRFLNRSRRSSVIWICIPQWSVLLCCWEPFLCFIQQHAFLLTVQNGSKKTSSKCGPKQLIIKGLATVLQG